MQSVLAANAPTAGMFDRHECLHARAPAQRAAGHVLDTFTKQTSQVQDALDSFMLPCVQQEATDVVGMMRGRHHMAYPIKGHWEGIYVLFSYISKPAIIPGVQKLLSQGRSGQEDDILRHITCRR